MAVWCERSTNYAMMDIGSGMREVQLTLDSVSVSYGARPVLANISLELRSSEVLVVSGANGSGKSSLLRVLCGLQQSSGGSVVYVIEGHVYTPAMMGQLIGWVAPDLQLYRELSGHENLRFFADVRGLDWSDLQIDDLLADVGLEGRGGDRVASYSTGMHQRLRYAYALLHQPPVLLLDEPTATLDAQGAALVERLIANQRRHGITIIATNDSRELRWGDYVLELG